MKVLNHVTGQLDEVHQDKPNKESIKILEMIHKDNVERTIKLLGENLYNELESKIQLLKESELSVILKTVCRIKRIDQQDKKE